VTSILVVEDYPPTLEAVSESLQTEGYEVVEATTGTEALNCFDNTVPDLIVLDVDIPAPDGFAVCAEVRHRPGRYIPIIFVSGLDELETQLQGFKTGGDHYVTKPFDMEELLETTKTALRQHSDDSTKLSVYEIEYDLETGEVFYHGKEVEPLLSKKELELLEKLLRRPSKLFSRLDLTDRYIDPRSIDQHIKNLRRKFKNYGPDPIKTVPTRGYRLAKPQ
jgi:DNA-binding response OmpR family regulator